MTKQQIFLMYSGNTPFYDKSSDYKFNALSIEIEKQTINGIYKFSDCQLVLKPIAEMSEEDSVIYNEITDDMRRYITNTQYPFQFPNSCRNLSVNEATKLTTWLITHGYALDDTWFTNGIAIKESKHE